MALKTITKKVARKAKKSPPSKKPAGRKLKSRSQASDIRPADTPEETTEIFKMLIILTFNSDKPEGQMTPLEKMNIVDQGVTKKDLESLKEKTKLDYDELAELLSVGRATLINKKGDEKFSHPISEKIVGLADLYSYGYEVFEDNERFNQWMQKANQALGGKAPYDLIHNQFGLHEVRNLVGRIEYGVYS